MTGSVAIWQVVVAVVLHACLVGLIYRAFGIAASVGYICGYFISLLPVLPLPFRSAHYLYASGATMSFGFAALLERARVRRQQWLERFLIVAVGIAVVHGLKIQWFLYDTGRCQHRLLTSLDGFHDTMGSGKDRRIFVIADAGVSLSIAMRALFGRSKYQDDGRPFVTFDAPGQSIAGSSTDGAVTLRMTKSCVLVPE